MRRLNINLLANGHWRPASERPGDGQGSHRQAAETLLLFGGGRMNFEAEAVWDLLAIMMAEPVESASLPVFVLSSAFVRGGR